MNIMMTSDRMNKKVFVVFYAFFGFCGFSVFFCIQCVGFKLCVCCVMLTAC